MQENVWSTPLLAEIAVRILEYTDEIPGDQKKIMTNFSQKKNQDKFFTEKKLRQIFHRKKSMIIKVNEN